MRCPQCNKFVAYDEPQIEVNSVEVDNGTVRSSVRVVLSCADCGTELKDAEIEAETEIEHTCSEPAKPDEGWDDEQDQFTVEAEGDGEPNQRSQDKDRNGKQIKNPRYMKTFYGFTLSSEIHCCKCGESFSVETEGEAQASGFNECC